MAKFHHALTDAKLRAAKPKDIPYKLADGGGLYALIAPTGTVCWRYNYKIGGVGKTLAIGTYPILSIKMARQAHREFQATVQLGGDPMAERKEIKEEKKRHATFREIAADWLSFRKNAAEAANEGKPRAEKSKSRDELMVAYLNGEFGDTPIAELSVPHLAKLLRTYEAAGKFETRVRIQGAAVSIAGYAVGQGIIKANPFLGVKFADAFTSPNENPRPAIIDPDQFGHLLRKVDHFEGREGNITGIGLNLLALTAVRPGEMASGKWCDIDFDRERWIVPPDAAKMRTHRKKTNSPRAGKGLEVPLSRQALALLKELHRLTGQGKYLFPGRQKARNISENTFNNALQSLGYQGQHCAHGYRSSFSSIMNEQFRDVGGGHQSFFWEKQDVLIEMQLDHDDASTRAIYARGGRYPHRVELMQHWADLIDRLRSGNAPAIQKPRLVAAA